MPLSASETITGTETIYKGRIVTLKVHQVRLDDGRESQREIVEHRGAAAMVPLTDDGQVLMVSQYRLAAGAKLLEIPAGSLDPGEDPRTAAEREIQEEIGFRAGTWEELGAFYVSPGWATEKITVFLARDLTPSPGQMDEDEAIEVVSLPFQEALARCQDGRIQDSKSIAGLMLAACRLGH